MAWDKDDLCVECKSHFAEPHDIDCSLKDGIKFLPLTEQQIRESIAKLLRQRASEACYWKEHFEDKNYPESADFQRTLESIWNEAADIALGIRKE